MALELSDVLAVFMWFCHLHVSIFKDLGGGIVVRDEGVAGSNPATPTISKQVWHRYGTVSLAARRLWERQPINECVIIVIGSIKSSPLKIG
jgi:hypothetical protein